MMTSHFDSTPIITKYKGYTISKGIQYIYQGDVEIQRHRGYGIYKGAGNFIGFRFTLKAAKDLISYHDQLCLV
jgi:hypothetical protein